MSDGVVLESSVGAKDSGKSETSKSPWGFLRHLSGKFKRNIGDLSPSDEANKAKDLEVSVVHLTTEEDQGEDQQREIIVEKPDPQRLYFDRLIMETANKPDLIYSEAVKFLDAGAISALPPTRTDVAFTEACRKLETAAYLHRTLVDFANFVRSKPDFSLEDAYDFANGYLSVCKNGKFDKQAPQKYTESMATTISEVENFINATLREGDTKDKRKLNYYNGYPWYKCQAIGANGLGSTIGRIYINASPEFAGKVFRGLVETLIKDSNVSFLIKALNPVHRSIMSEYYLNRPDKFVVYFNGQDEAEMLAKLQDFYHSILNGSSHLLNTETPPFAVGLVDQTHQQKMSGIAFAQDPPLHVEDSFNEVMKQILYKVSLLVTRDSSNQDEVEREFIRLTQEAGFDPYNPAFRQGSQESFHDVAANSSYV